MRNSWLLASLALGLVASASVQKQWANAAEYGLFDHVSHVHDPALQIEILLEWETSFPTSDYQPERLAFLINAYKNAGRPADAFASATQLLKLEPENLMALGMIAALAPSLDAPSPAQVKITEAAARRLLARAVEIGQMATAVRPRSADTSPEQANDAETRRVVGLLRQWRVESARKKPIRTAADVENEITTLAEKALAWAKGISN